MESKQFLIDVLNERIDMWSGYVYMVDESKKTDRPILGTDEEACRKKINKAREVLIELKKEIRT